MVSVVLRVVVRVSMWIPLDLRLRELSGGITLRRTVIGLLMAVGWWAERKEKR